MPYPRILALDVGKARIGLAITDPILHAPQPLLTLWRKTRGEDLRSLLRLIRKHEITDILVGNPLHLSGDLSPWAAKVHEFADLLHQRSALPVHLVDERLTSVAAHEILDEAGHPRGATRKHLIDQVAAVLILESWLQAKQQDEALRTTDSPPQ